jgi:hypothetical protein
MTDRQTRKPNGISNDRSLQRETLKIVNRYMYTENDTLVLKNYRIAC